MQKLFIFFQLKKHWHIWDINVWNFNVSLTNGVVSFKQLGPGKQKIITKAFRHCNTEETSNVDAALYAYWAV